VGGKSWEKGPPKLKADVPRLGRVIFRGRSLKKKAKGARTDWEKNLEEHCRIARRYIVTDLDRTKDREWLKVLDERGEKIDLLRKNLLSPKKVRPT